VARRQAAALQNAPDAKSNRVWSNSETNDPRDLGESQIAFTLVQSRRWSA
jgi:hypothetical protein